VYYGESQQVGQSEKIQNKLKLTPWQRR